MQLCMKVLSFQIPGHSAMQYRQSGPATKPSTAGRKSSNIDQAAPCPRLATPLVQAAGAVWERQPAGPEKQTIPWWDVRVTLCCSGCPVPHTGVRRPIYSQVAPQGSLYRQGHAVRLEGRCTRRSPVGVPPSESSSSPSGEPSLAAASLATASSRWVPAELRLPAPPEELRLLSAGEVAIWASEPRCCSTAASRRCLQHTLQHVSNDDAATSMCIANAPDRGCPKRLTACAAHVQGQGVQGLPGETGLAIAVVLNCHRGLLTPQASRIPVLA